MTSANPAPISLPLPTDTVTNFPSALPAAEILNWNRIVPGTIRSILRGERPVLRSDGSYIRDYFYVEDGAAAYLHLAEKMAENPALAGEAFNFSNEIQLTVIDLVRKILAAMGSSLEPDIQGTASNEIMHQYLSAEKARRLLGWRSEFTLDTALAATIGWYQNYLAVEQPIASLSHRT
jgi:CDP-glucose 4,6-dehydratase